MQNKPPWQVRFNDLFLWGWKKVGSNPPDHVLGLWTECNPETDPELEPCSCKLCVDEIIKRSEQ